MDKEAQLTLYFTAKGGRNSRRILEQGFSKEDIAADWMEMDSPPILMTSEINSAARSDVVFAIDISITPLEREAWIMKITDTYDEWFLIPLDKANTSPRRKISRAEIDAFNESIRDRPLLP